MPKHPAGADRVGRQKNRRGQAQPLKYRKRILVIVSISVIKSDRENLGGKIIRPYPLNRLTQRTNGVMFSHIFHLRGKRTDRHAGKDGIVFIIDAMIDKDLRAASKARLNKRKRQTSPGAFLEFHYPGNGAGGP